MNKLRQRPESLIRVMIGLVFVSEGLQKFFFPDDLGTAKIPNFINPGFWKTAHDSRTGFAMSMGLLFLILLSSNKASLK